MPCRNVDKIREFIKKVYVEKTNAVEKSLDWPPKDPKVLITFKMMLTIYD